MMSGVKPLFKTKNKKYIMNDLEREMGNPVTPISEPQMEVPMKEYRPSNTSALKEWPLQIDFLDRGCLVTVGCKRIAFESVHKAMVAINAYVTNPWDEQQKWHKILD
jgi:hypothetical protein